MNIQEGDIVILTNLNSDPLSLHGVFHNGRKGGVVDVDDIQILVQFSSDEFGQSDYWWFQEENLKLDISSVRDKKLKDLGI